MEESVNWKGEELGPLEIQINSLTKSMATQQEEIGELQQRWLHDQLELVQLSRSNESSVSDLDRQRKEHTIFTQKRLRIESISQLAVHPFFWNYDAFISRSEI